LGTPSVIVDPTTASLAQGGLVTLTGAGDDFFQAHISAVIKSFPSASDRFVIMDLSELQAVIGQTNLRQMDPIELWVATPNSEKYLEKLATTPFRQLQVASQNNVAKELRSDPLNVGLAGAYKAALFYALLLATFMYGSALPLLYKDGAGVLFQVEAEGMAPRRLRRTLRGALRICLAVALLTGTSIGLLIGHFFISPSTPYALVSLFMGVSVLVGELGGLLLTQRFFNETTMVK
jgi:hypothetical protein